MVEGSVGGANYNPSHKCPVEPNDQRTRRARAVFVILRGTVFAWPKYGYSLATNARSHHKLWIVHGKICIVFHV